MCFAAQFQNWPQKFGLFAQCVGLKNNVKAPKKCKSEIAEVLYAT